MELDGLGDLIGRPVVVDTCTPMLYLGTLVQVDAGLLHLEGVDVHDSTESQASKELYIIEAKKFGVKVNRKSARVVGGTVVSVSPLEDVISF